MIINSSCTYTTGRGHIVDYSEDIRWSDTHYGKYNNGMANYLDRANSEDDWTGCTDWGVYIRKFGKRLLLTDDQGFVTVGKYPTEADAITAFEAINIEYGEWLDANEGETW